MIRESVGRSDCQRNPARDVQEVLFGGEDPHRAGRPEGRDKQLDFLTLASLILLVLLSLGFFGSSSAVAEENEIDFGALGFIEDSIRADGFDCSFADIGHILYLDEIVSIFEVFCRDGNIYEVVDIRSSDNLIVVPFTNTESEQDLETIDRHLRQNA